MDEPTEKPTESLDAKVEEEHKRMGKFAKAAVIGGAAGAVLAWAGATVYYASLINPAQGSGPEQTIALYAASAFLASRYLLAGGLIGAAGTGMGYAIYDFVSHAKHNPAKD
jgi:hypothetical protein